MKLSVMALAMLPRSSSVGYDVSTCLGISGRRSGRNQGGWDGIRRQKKPRVKRGMMMKSSLKEIVVSMLLSIVTA